MVINHPQLMSWNVGIIKKRLKWDQFQITYQHHFHQPTLYLNYVFLQKTPNLALKRPYIAKINNLTARFCVLLKSSFLVKRHQRNIINSLEKHPALSLCIHQPESLHQFDHGPGNKSLLIKPFAFRQTLLIDNPELAFQIIPYLLPFFSFFIKLCNPFHKLYCVLRRNGWIKKWKSQSKNNLLLPYKEFNSI